MSDKAEDKSTEVIESKTPTEPEVIESKTPTEPEVIESKTPTEPEVVESKTPTEPEVVESKTPTEDAENKVRILDMPTETQNEALQCIVQFLSLAQRRGAFQLEEASKIVDCLKLFSQP